MSSRILRIVDIYSGENLHVAIRERADWHHFEEFGCRSEPEAPALSVQNSYRFLSLYRMKRLHFKFMGLHLWVRKEC